MYGLFGEFLRVLPLKFHFRMIFQTYPASLGQFGACDDFFQLALLLVGGLTVNLGHNSSHRPNWPKFAGCVQNIILKQNLRGSTLKNSPKNSYMLLLAFFLSIFLVRGVEMRGSQGRQGVTQPFFEQQIPYFAWNFV